MKKYADNHQCKTKAEAVEYAVAQFEGLKAGKPVRRPGWLYLDTLDEIERRAKLKQEKDDAN
ncbi:hypothetical protein [Hafnia psychrotolerans]|uniref:Uncharacterized protein n=1 Tax=Hafnia psychrotolerans TaxID=1477018 RepID=A0ABQ1G827_9GAMM|nr:hypothetical protein [Hafnia psychrotolerans]GGA38542.1 hypothetical protein GCM10011328_11730 [Hafnia psychrotolerans]